MAVDGGGARQRCAHWSRRRAAAFDRRLRRRRPPRVGGLRAFRVVRPRRASPYLFGRVDPRACRRCRAHLRAHSCRACVRRVHDAARGRAAARGRLDRGDRLEALRGALPDARDTAAGGLLRAVGKARSAAQACRRASDDRAARLLDARAALGLRRIPRQGRIAAADRCGSAGAAGRNRRGLADCRARRGCVVRVSLSTRLSTSDRATDRLLDRPRLDDRRVDPCGFVRQGERAACAFGGYAGRPAVGRPRGPERVALLVLPGSDGQRALEQLFWNRSITDVLRLDAKPIDGYEQPRIDVADDGGLLVAGRTFAGPLLVQADGSRATFTGVTQVATGNEFAAIEAAAERPVRGWRCSPAGCSPTDGSPAGRSCGCGRMRPAGSKELCSCACRCRVAVVPTRSGSTLRESSRRSASRRASRVTSPLRYRNAARGRSRCRPRRRCYLGLRAVSAKAASPVFMRTGGGRVSHAPPIAGQRA